MSENMFNYFILRDARLKGSLPFLAGGLITSQVDALTPLATAFSRISMTAKARGKLKTLFILCHGYGSGSGQSDFWWHGGIGLQLGKESLTSANVSAWSAIKDCVETIVIYACGAAYTGPSSWTNLQSINDGQSLMKELSKRTNAVVFAADRIQWYLPVDMNFGKWEGTVYMFFPTGLVLPNFTPSAELIEVISPPREKNNHFWS